MAREIVNHLELEFGSLINSLKELVSSVPPDLLYRTPPAVSVGESILRSAATVEQACGGLTANLWDDPFEWTLPETLSNADRISEYLAEVESALRRTFNAIVDDGALSKLVSVPSGEPVRLISLLLGTLVTAADHRGRAVATLRRVQSSSFSLPPETTA
ncbi:MAG TPA: hypothetical protein VFY60_15815 [Pyrinomonadaceae bacterium]|nr:hypothetical protein [Pyrinomonadaceae bacterium]